MEFSHQSPPLTTPSLYLSSSLRMAHYSMISFLILTSFGGDSLLLFAFFLGVTLMVDMPNLLPLQNPTPPPSVLPLPIPLSLWMELQLLPVVMRPDALLLLTIPLPLDDIDAVADAAFVIDNGIVIYCCPLSKNGFGKIKTNSLHE